MAEKIKIILQTRLATEWSGVGGGTRFISEFRSADATVTITNVGVTQAPGGSSATLPTPIVGSFKGQITGQGRVDLEVDFGETVILTTSTDDPDDDPDILFTGYRVVSAENLDGLIPFQFSNPTSFSQLTRTIVSPEESRFQAAPAFSSPPAGGGTIIVQAIYVTRFGIMPTPTPIPTPLPPPAVNIQVFGRLETEVIRDENGEPIVNFAPNEIDGNGYSIFAGRIIRSPFNPIRFSTAPGDGRLGVIIDESDFPTEESGVRLIFAGVKRFRNLPILRPLIHGGGPSWAELLRSRSDGVLGTTDSLASDKLPIAQVRTSVGEPRVADGEVITYVVLFRHFVPEDEPPAPPTTPPPPLPTPPPTAPPPPPTAPPPPPPTPTPTPTPIPTWRSCITGEIAQGFPPSTYIQVPFPGLGGGTCWEPPTTLGFNPLLDNIFFGYRRGTSKFPMPFEFDVTNPSFALSYRVNFNVDVRKFVVSPQQITIGPRETSRKINITVRRDNIDNFNDGLSEEPFSVKIDRI